MIATYPSYCRAFGLPQTSAGELEWLHLGQLPWLRHQVRFVRNKLKGSDPMLHVLTAQLDGFSAELASLSHAVQSGDIPLAMADRLAKFQSPRARVFAIRVELEKIKARIGAKAFVAAEEATGEAPTASH